MTLREYSIDRSSTEQRLSLYVIICTLNSEQKLYIGQTGNKNKGCSNITTRVGKHLAYSGDDNNLRKHLEHAERWNLEVVFKHVHEYDGTNTKVPEMLALENLLIRELSVLSKDHKKIEVLNTVENVNEHLLDESGKLIVNEVKKRVEEKLITSFSKGRS